MSGWDCTGWGCGGSSGGGWDSGGWGSGGSDSGFKLPTEADNKNTARMIGGADGADESELEAALNEDLGIRGSEKLTLDQLKGFLSNLGFSRSDAESIAEGVEDEYPKGLTGDQFLEKILSYDEDGNGKLDADEFGKHNEAIAELGEKSGW